MRPAIFVMAALLLLFALPAQAGITFGVVRDPNALTPAEEQAGLLAAHLQRELGEEVKVLVFAEEAVLRDWLSDFREVDLAVISRARFQGRPAGELRPVAECRRPAEAGSTSPDLVVAGPGMDPGLLARIRRILSAMDADPAGRRVLRELEIERFVPPAPGQAERAPPPAAKVAPLPAPEEAAAGPEPEPLPPAGAEPGTVQKGEGAAAEERFGRERLSLLALLALLGGGLAWLSLRRRRGGGSRTGGEAAGRPDSKPGLSAAERLALLVELAAGGEEADAALAAEPSGPAPAPRPCQVVGELDAALIMAVFEMMISYSRPATLVVRTRNFEKRFHFRNGMLSAAACRIREKRNDAAFLMNALGYLLVRGGRTTVAERDLALEQCARDPGIHIGEALVELGAITAEELREALRAQAREVVFSLFLFPEGSVELIHEELPVKPENELLLGVADLLHEVARFAEEWDQIRRAIPSLQTVLDFTEKGREKLGRAKLSDHQRSVLALVDGKRTIEEISIESNMLDFEVCKFIHLLAHAGILQGLRSG